MQNPMPYQDAIHDAQFAVTQAEELLDLARARLAKAKEAYLKEFLQPPTRTPPATGFTHDPIMKGQSGTVHLDKTTVAHLHRFTTPQCWACQHQTNGPHTTTDPRCIFHDKESNNG